MFAQSVWLSNYQCENCSMGEADKRSWNSKSRPSCNPQSCCPCNAVMPDNNQQTDKLVCGNYRITTEELYSTPPTHKGSVMALTEELGCSKICAQWVPQMLTDAHKEEGKTSHRPFAPTWYKRWGLPAAVCHRGRNLGPPVQTQMQVAVTEVVGSHWSGATWHSQGRRNCKSEFAAENSWLQPFGMREVWLSYY